MIREFAVVSPGATLREAAIRLRNGKGRGEGGMPSLLVMEGDRLEGIVTLSDLVKVIVPPYIKADRHLAHLGWDGLLEAQCKRVHDQSVREIMTKKVITIEEDSVLTEVAELLFAHAIHSLPVLQGRKVVGIVYLSDLAIQVFTTLEAQTGD
jgi:CBS domain-containing protein